MRSILKTQKKDKTGQMGIIFFFIIILLILIVGFILSVSIGIFNYVGDELTPILTDLGQVNISSTSDINFSESGQYTFGTLNTFNQNLAWVIGFLYVAALLFSIGFVIAFESNPNPFFIGMYFLFMVLIIFGAIILSNMYQDIYEGDDEIASRLREQTLLSYMILYSPFILGLIATIAGIYLFARPQEASGGFGI